MHTGDIILIPFPFAELTNVKVGPSVVVAHTKDKYKDIIVCAISSVVPSKLSEKELLIIPDLSNNLRAKSIIKVDRIVTLKAEDKIGNLGKLSKKDLILFRGAFISLVE